MADSVLIIALLVTLMLILSYALIVSMRRPCGRERFTYATPATPLERDAVAALRATLDRIDVLGREVSRRQPATNRTKGAARSAQALLPALARFRGALAAPPTYANYLSVYRGLGADQRALLSAADAYTRAGDSIHNELDATAPGASDGDEAALGAALKEIGHSIRRAVRATHDLGVALDME
jgi:cbb3-type cytochrome oxidase subunit 3